MALRSLVPSIWEEGRLNVEALRTALGEVPESGPDRFLFSWAGRNAAIQGLLQSTASTLKPKPTESVRFDTADNLLVRGDNLEALKVLYRSYFGQVKLIYIDPPYNSGSDFIYPDNFADPVKAYLRYSGQTDENGVLLSSNPETSGRYHSAWLSMMYPRLFLGRQLLHDDGVIVVSIDDHEVAHLRLLLDEVFGSENFVGTVIWNSTKSVTNTALISVSHTYNIIYARNKAYFTKNRSHFRLPEPGEGFSNTDDDPRGPWKADPFQVGGERPNQQYVIVNPKTGKRYRPNPGCSWKNDKNVFDRLIADNRIIFGASGEAGPQRKRFQWEAEERGRVAKTLWDDLPATSNATRDLDSIFGRHIFDNPKPVELIKRFISLGVHDPEDAIVMDFFAGSGTTAQAVLEMNASDGGRRRFILVQLPEPIEDREFGTIFDLCRERLTRYLAANKSIKAGFRVLSLDASNFPKWQAGDDIDAEQYDAQLKLSLSALPQNFDRLAVIYEIALREGYGATLAVERLSDVSTNEISRVTDTRLGRSFFACLDATVKSDTVRALGRLLRKTDLLVCLDSALTDSQSANLAMTARLKTV